MREEIREIRAIDCHSHHLGYTICENITLGDLLRKTYLNWAGVALEGKRSSKTEWVQLKDTLLNWCGATLEESEESRLEWIDRSKTKNTWRFLRQSFADLYGWDELSVENWEKFSNELNQKHKDPQWSRSILRDYCRYDRVLVDSYWKSGIDHDDPEVFAKVFRVDPFFLGYAPGKLDHDRSSALKNYGIQSDNLKDYLNQVGELIEKRVREGVVSIKNATAYDRHLYYQHITEAEASRVFETKDPTPEQEVAFQDFFFDWVCDLAAQLDVPIQCHTGMGSLTGTRAIEMEKVLRRHPNTKFSLMHGSFPWTSDMLALAAAFENVWADICWLPLLSTTVCERFLHELIEAVDPNKVIWGCDTWVSEDSYAARLAVNDVLEKVLSAKVSEGYFSKTTALEYANKVLHDNAMVLFFNK